MYKSGVEIPQVDFSMLSCNSIAAGSYFIGFNLANSGKLSKMDCNGVITVIEGAGSSIMIEDSGVGSTVRDCNGNSASSDYSTISGGACNTILAVAGGIGGLTVLGSPATPVNANGIFYQDSTSGSGSGALIYLNISSGVIINVWAVMPGKDYQISDSITILGSQFGGTNGVDDVVIGVTETLSGGGVIGGGRGNLVNALTASIVGGLKNCIESDGFAGSIGGGCLNYVCLSYGTVSGGLTNSSTGLISTVAGGFSNVASETGTTVSGGGTNTASCSAATVGGGNGNIASGDTSTVSGGYNNSAISIVSTVSGGDTNLACGDYAYVGGGSCNTAAGCYSVVAGGQNNTASLYSGSCKYSTVSGGYANSASGYASVISGGGLNSSTNDASTVSGGYQNTASNAYATVVGGEGNTASGGRSIVGGGSCNTASGSYSGILGGLNNTAVCNYSFILGTSITADRDCTTFVNALSVKNMPTDADLPLPSGMIYLCTGDGTLRIA